MTERHHTANACQRSRRARNPRIDYYPNPEALAAIDAKRAEQRPRSVSATNRAVLNTIITEWAELTGIKKPGIDASKTSAGSTGIDRHKRARAYDFGGDSPSWGPGWSIQSSMKSCGNAFPAARVVIVMDYLVEPSASRASGAVDFTGGEVLGRAPPKGRPVPWPT